MKVIENRPHRWGWGAFEGAGVEPVFPNKDQAIDKRDVNLIFASKCRMIRHDSRRSAFNRLPLAAAGMVTVKRRIFRFLAVVLVGLLFSSCAAHHRRVAISGPAPAGAAELNITQSIIPAGIADALCIGRCVRHLSLFIRPTIRRVAPTHCITRSP